MSLLGFGSDESPAGSAPTVTKLAEADEVIPKPTTRKANSTVARRPIMGTHDTNGSTHPVGIQRDLIGCPLPSMWSALPLSGRFYSPSVLAMIVRWISDVPP